MIKKWVIVVAMVVMACNVKAQNMVSPKPSLHCRPVYMGLSTGLENQSGMIGFNIDVPVARPISLGGGFKQLGDESICRRALLF